MKKGFQHGQPKRFDRQMADEHNDPYRPKKKLPQEVIDRLTTWVKMGAPDPRRRAKITVESKIDIESGKAAIIGALVLGLVNVFVKPLAVFLTLPLTIITLGLFLIVVNAAMLMLMAAFVPGVKVKGFPQALMGGLLLAVLNTLVSAIFGV